MIENVSYICEFCREGVFGEEKRWHCITDEKWLKKLKVGDVSL